jgi:signal transduction histidine kinase/CheY-like chemotaxis protein/ligand-binding sensor domain-containing protein
MLPLRIALIFLAAVNLWPQRYLFRDYRQENGLANLVVTCLHQDRQNFLWIGTQNGLYRYDGVRFRSYGLKDGLPGSYVLALAEDREGWLWVYTNQGLGRMRGQEVREELRFSSPNEELHLGLVVDGKGRVFASGREKLWFGEPDRLRGTYRFRPVTVEGHAGPLHQLALTREGTVWFGCRNTVCSYDPAGQEIRGVGDDLRPGNLGPGSGLPPGDYRGIAVDAQGSLFVRSGRRIYRKDPGDLAFALFANLPEGKAPDLLFAGGKRDLFVPVANGLWIWQSEARAWHKVQEQQALGGEALAGERIAGVLEDHEESLWIGLTGGGLKRWLGYREWEGFTTEDGLGHNIVWNLLRDGEGRLWAATDAGLSWFDESERRWRPFAGQDGAAWGRVYSLAPGSEGRMYALSLHKGLVVVDCRRMSYRLLGKPAGADARLTYSIWREQNRLRNGAARLWFGTSAGLFTAEESAPLAWQRAEGKPYSPGETFFTISQDSLGRIWAAGNQGAWVRNPDGRWKHWTTQEGLRSNLVWYARETKPGMIWFGYLESLGLSRLLWDQNGKEQWMHVTEQEMAGPDGFLNYFIGLDAKNQHWVGSDRGVFVVKDKNIQVRHFTDQDGLLWNDCNSNAFYADRDGSVWIGTSRGLAHTKLQRPIETTPGKLRISRIRINESDQPLGNLPGEPLPVPSRPNQLEIEASPMTFRFDTRLQFRFRLRSGGDSWAVRPANQISFTQLRPGSDWMEAQFRADRYPWSESVSVPLEVSANFWESWWGRGLLAVLLLGVFAGLAAWLWNYRNFRLLDEKAALEAAVRQRTEVIENLLWEAQQASKMKSQFLANVSHEIRTPMNGVLGMLQLLEASKLDASQREQLKLAKNSAGSLLSLLNEVLDFSKIESGHVALDPRSFDLRQLLEEVTALFRPAALEKGLRLELEVEGFEERPVWADELRLRQVLVNLLGNAVKFTDSGRVKLSVRREENPEAGPDLFTFRVEDEGIGIDPGKLSKIFEAFHQADGGTTRRYGGTGLGLAIAQRLVSLMGGEIRVESIPGLGSTFQFGLRLPWAEALAEASAEVSAEASAEEANSREASHSRMPPLRILVAEDNRINQHVVLKMLEAEGQEVKLASDGAEAMEALQCESFDLVFMDVHMPVMDGLKATERIRAWEKASGRKRTPIVALTAGVLEEERQRCLAAGMDDFLGKPLSREQLRAILVQRSQNTATPGAIQG